MDQEHAEVSSPAQSVALQRVVIMDSLASLAWWSDKLPAPWNIFFPIDERSFWLASGFSLFFLSPSMAFLGEFPFHGAHCFHSLIIKGRVQVSL